MEEARHNEISIEKLPARLLHKILYGVYTVLMLLALAYLIYRGPVRCFTRVCSDLPCFYSSGAAWVLGADPYDLPSLNRIFHERGGPSDGVVQITVHLPCSLPLFALFSLLSYPTVNVLIVAANVLLIPVVLLLIIELFADRAPRDWFLKFFILIACAWAPVHTSISQGQNTLAGMALLLWGVLLANHRRFYGAGVVFAIGAALRSSFFFPFGLWYLLNIRHHLRLGAGALATFMLIALLAIGRMEIAGVEWWESYTQTLRSFQQEEAGPLGVGSASIAPDRPSRFIMINLQPLLSTWTGTGWLTHYLPLVFVAGLIVFLWRLRKRCDGAGAMQTIEPLELAILSVLSLLCIYNRFYSAVLLLIPLAWGLSVWHNPVHRRVARPMVMLLMVFLVPGTAFLLSVLPKVLPDDVLLTWWWHWLILPYQIYCLILVATLLSISKWRDSRSHATPLTK